MKVAPSPTPDARVVVYLAPGSPAAHFAAKVVVACDAYNIQHYCSFVHIEPAKRKLPSGGTTVPEVTIGDTIVSDSETILHELDERFGTALFPSELAGNLSRRASDDTLLGCALYYNLVFPPTYARSTHKYVANLLPSYLCCFTGMVADSALAPFRERNRAKALKLLALGESPAEPDVRERLLCELEFFQSHLETEEQPYLLPGSSRPSAADISLYVLVERIVGTMGDVPLPAPLPELPAEEEARLGRLWKWHQRMRAAHPIVYKGKRVPKA